MQDYKSYFLTTILALSISVVSIAQTFSPYSQYGLGDQRSTSFSINKAMGGISAGFIDSRNINYTNPASYAGLNYTVFDIGANLHGNVLADSSGVLSEAANGGVNHLALGFPVMTNRWGMSFGILPYSNMNYRYTSQASVGDLDYTQIGEGKGSTYQFYLGNGVRVGKFNLGLNAAFLFGEIDHTTATSFEDSLDYNNSQLHNKMAIRDIIFNAGIQYRTKINKLENSSKDKEDIFMTVGAYGSPGFKVDAFSSTYLEATRPSTLTGNPIPIDTAAGSNFEDYGRVHLPATFGVGVTFGNENTWTLGADFHYENWKQFKSPLSNDLETVNDWKVKIGGQIMPDYEGNRYGQRIEYRLGAQFGKTRMIVDNNALTDIGMSFGLGMPFKKYPTMKRSLSSLNMTMEIGRRGTIDNGGLKENYYKFTLAYTLSDKWFIKRKFD